MVQLLLLASLSFGQNFNLGSASGGIVAGSVDTAGLANGAVTAPKLADASVQTAKLGTDSVTAAKILAGAVDTNKLSDGAVTASKILGLAVRTQAINSNAVTSAKLASDTASLAQVSGGNMAATASAVTFFTSTVTVSNSGAVSFGSQPTLVLNTPAHSALQAGTSQDMYWSATAINRNVVYHAATSSSTVTVPASGAGDYKMVCALGYSATASTDVRVVMFWTGNQKECRSATDAGAGAFIHCEAWATLAAGDTFKCGTYSASNTTLNSSTGYFIFHKEN